MKTFVKTVCFMLLLVLAAQGLRTPPAEAAITGSPSPILVTAVMSETIEKFAPVNAAVVFSNDLGRVVCFTEFDPVPDKTVIYHKWYHRGSLISVKQLTINPPRWSSFTSMQLRATDIGPWQVAVTDDRGAVFQTLRFSITE